MVLPARGPPRGEDPRGRGLPDVHHYVRLHAGQRWTDDLGASTNVNVGEQAVTGSHLAQICYGADSEQDYAARIIWEFRALRANIKRGDHDMANYLAARLGMLVTEAELQPDLAVWDHSLAAATLTRQERARETEAAARAIAQHLVEQNPALSTLRLAVLVRAQLEREGHDYLPSERTIRRYLSEK